VESVNIKVLKKTGNELKIEIEGEGHTFCNLLQSMLNEDKYVEVAGYDLPHPLIPKAILYLRTKKDRSPDKVMENALERIREVTNEFLRLFQQTGRPPQ
jgi:DNA-directed RNA polymerase subunit L